MRILVLFNLKSGVDPKVYEDGRQDRSAGRQRAGVDFGLFGSRRDGLLGSDATPPYQYFEIVDIADMEAFGRDVAGETMQRVAAEFRQFADNPLFLTSRVVGG